MDVLEFGCGTGPTSIANAPYVKHIRAIDISAKIIEIAQGKADAGGIGNVSFEQLIIENLDAPDETFYAVMGHSILHLLENKEDAVAKVRKTLKPGGGFFSSTACIDDFLKILKAIAPIGRFFGVLPLVKVFTVKELEDNLIVAGFTIDTQWQPSKTKGVFIVAKKAGYPRSTSFCHASGWCRQGIARRASRAGNPVSRVERHNSARHDLRRDAT